MIPTFLAEQIEFNSRVGLYGQHFKPFSIHSLFYDYMRYVAWNTPIVIPCGNCNQPLLNEDDNDILNENGTPLYNG